MIRGRSSTSAAGDNLLMRFMVQERPKSHFEVGRPGPILKPCRSLAHNLQEFCSRNSTTVSTALCGSAWRIKWALPILASDASGLIR
jgi:hypothetical protein